MMMRVRHWRRWWHHVTAAAANPIAAAAAAAGRIAISVQILVRGTQRAIAAVAIVQLLSLLPVILEHAQLLATGAVVAPVVGGRCGRIPVRIWHGGWRRRRLPEAGRCARVQGVRRRTGWSGAAAATAAATIMCGRRIGRIVVMVMLVIGTFRWAKARDLQTGNERNE